MGQGLAPVLAGCRCNPERGNGFERLTANLHQLLQCPGHRRCAPRQGAASQAVTLDSSIVWMSVNPIRGDVSPLEDPQENEGGCEGLDVTCADDSSRPCLLHHVVMLEYGAVSQVLG
jgi:hypothetical protein